MCFLNCSSTPVWIVVSEWRHHICLLTLLYTFMCWKIMCCHCLVGVQPGHIPGSKCMPFFSFLDDKGMFLPAEELKKFFNKSQVDLKKPLCGSCGSGVTACHMVMAAHLCGAPGALVYDGSWYEWFIRAPPQHVATEVKSKAEGGWTKFTLHKTYTHPHSCLWFLLNFLFPYFSVTPLIIIDGCASKWIVFARSINLTEWKIQATF